MSAKTKTTASAAAFINREISWLAFNERVLEEAVDRSVRLLERLKFASIVASNLDEFFMVRVARLRQAVVDGDVAADLAGLTPVEQLAAVRERTHTLVDSLYELVANELLPGLARHGVRLLAWSELDRSQQAALGAVFRDALLPVLTPIAVDEERPFPWLSSLTLNLALRLDPEPGAPEWRLAIVQVPSGVARLIPVPGSAGHTFVLVEQVISAHLHELFPGQSIAESSVFRLSRDAELELDDEGGRTQLELVEREVRRRRRHDVVRLEVGAGASDAIVERLRGHLEVTAEDVYVARGPVDIRVLMALVDLPGLDALRDPPHQPFDVLAEIDEPDLFSVLNERDLLLHHPYESYDPVVALLAQAADDPDVLAIKQTLYRTSGNSSIIASLQRAAERNKQVTVLVELTARFDEERNIQWARALEEAGAHVIYGVHGYKTHAKICLIVRRGATGLQRYVHLATGNYNERTARLYTDFGLLTASPVIAQDASTFLNALTGYSDPPHLQKLVMAPTQLRHRLLALVDRERRNAEAGQPAQIAAKMNSLIDRQIIKRLCAASESGVKIRLNVRGICALRPGVVGLSTNIQVVSIVDRFLEHSRIYHFLNGGNDEVYLSSADWMTRNLDKRVELMFPVEDPACKAKVLDALDAMFRDNTKARWLGADGVYRRRKLERGETPFRVQQFLDEETRRLASHARAGVSFRPERGRSASSART
jgi:polyphosphate kinase